MPTRPVPITDALKRLSEVMPKDGFKEALNAFLTEPMEVELAALCEAVYGERTDERAVSRNLEFFLEARGRGPASHAFVKHFFGPRVGYFRLWYPLSRNATALGGALDVREDRRPDEDR